MVHVGGPRMLIAQLSRQRVQAQTISSVNSLSSAWPCRMHCSHLKTFAQSWFTHLPLLLAPSESTLWVLSFSSFNWQKTSITDQFPVSLVMKQICYRTLRDLYHLTAWTFWKSDKSMGVFTLESHPKDVLRTYYSIRYNIYFHKSV